MGQDLANIGARAPAPEESPAPAGARRSRSGGLRLPPKPRQGTRRLHLQQRPPHHPRVRLPVRLRQMHHRRRDNGAALLAVTRQMANTTPGGSSPAAPSAQTPGAPWPIQTAGLPPMYSAAWHHVHLYAPRSINPDSNMPAYVFSTKNDASPESVLQKRCNFPVPMRHRQAGRLFPRTMQNVWWLI